MPKIKQGAAVDTVLNELVFTALFKADYEQKRGLKGKYLKAATSERAARVFAEKSTKEEKEYVLAYLGYSFYYVIQESDKTLKHIKQFLPILTSGKKSAIAKAISAEGLYITSDRELLRVAGLVSRNTHHPSYFLDLEVIRQGYHIAKWSKRYGGAKDFTFRDADESSRIINRNMVNTVLNADYADGLIGCPKNQLCILQYLYSALNDVSEQQLKDFFSGRMSNISFKYALRTLVDENKVSRANALFSITGTGIKKVNDFFHSVIHSNSF